MCSCLLWVLQDTLMINILFCTILFICCILIHPLYKPTPSHSTLFYSNFKLWFVRTLDQDNAKALFIFILTNCQNHWWIAFLTVRVNEYLSDLWNFCYYSVGEKSLMLLAPREHAFWNQMPCYLAKSRWIINNHTISLSPPAPSSQHKYSKQQKYTMNLHWNKKSKVNNKNDV